MQPKLQAEFDAAKRLMVLIHSDVGEDDDDVRADMVEGETALLPAIDASLRRIAELETMAAACKAEASIVSERAGRFLSAKDRLREEIRSIMITLAIRKLERPRATLSLGKGVSRLEIEDASEVPRQYMTRPEPVIDRKKLGDALKAGAEIPGARMAPPVQTITIRFG